MTTTPPDKVTAATKTPTPATSLKEAAPAKVTTSFEGNDIPEDNQLEFLYDAIEKLNPEKNDLNTVPKEITSSTLTTRLRGVCRINRLIDYASDLRHTFTEFGAKDRYQQCIEDLCDWILEKKIIEHIFGPNCHVEIIKQSHTILTFVAQVIDDEHVNVIWSASLLKHCGRQVLDLLTSLVRHMRTGPVLHLYWLVRNLSIEEHTEHTLLLTSCILRYIWLHSPCINQVHFCGLQENQDAQPGNASNEDQENSPHAIIEARDAFDRGRYSPVANIFTDNKLSRQTHRDHLTKYQCKLDTALDGSLDENKPHYSNPHDNSTFNGPKTATTANTTSTTTTSMSDFSLTQKKSKSEEDDIEWYNECMNQSRLGNGNSFDDQSTERSVSSHSNSDHDEKCLQQSLEDAIKGLDKAMGDRKQQLLTSPVSDEAAKSDDEKDREPRKDVKEASGYHLMGFVRAGSPTGVNHPDSSRQNLVESDIVSDDYDETVDPADSGDLDDEEPWAKHEEWIKDLKTGGRPFLDYASDASACCSEDKNMEDFEDDCQHFLPDDDTSRPNNPSANSNSSDICLLRDAISRRKRTLRDINRSTNKGESTSATKESETKLNSADGRNYLDSRTEHFQQLSAETVAHYEQLKKASLNLTSITTQICSDEDLKKLSEYNLANLSDPGKTLLWDLLQDGKIEHVGSNLYVEIENALVNLVMSFGGRFIRYKFIEACLENLALGNSVIISLRLLPRFMSFNTVARPLSISTVNETYSIVLWAEQEHNMSKNFFKNLVDYYTERRKLYALLVNQNGAVEPLDFDEDFLGNKSFFSHIEGIIMRMTFLSFIYSKSFSPSSMRLHKEQMDQLWHCLTSDPNRKCSDVLFQWIYQQAVSDDFHGVDDELMDYILKFKLPSLSPLNFRVRGLKLLEQLLWIRQEYECCHDKDHPATKLLWDIGFESLDDEVAMAAIRILNHFYVYTNHAKSVKCKQSTDFMRSCMSHLFTALVGLKTPIGENLAGCNVTTRSLEDMQKVILLIRTHLEVFKARWSFYLRTLQLCNEADLTSHRLNANDVKLTIALRLVVQSASGSTKTILEIQPNDFLGEIRAEIVKWWFTQVDRRYLENLSPSTSSETSSHSSELRTDQQDMEQTASCKQNAGVKDPIASQRLNSFTTFLLNSPESLRLLSQNQEIPFEWDERQVHELDFKDFQVIYVLCDTKADDLESEKSEDSEQSVSFPNIATIPSIAFLNAPKFERLMEVLEFLGSYKCEESVELTHKAKALSRRVWEIIQILPTCPDYKETLKSSGIESTSDMLADNPQMQNQGHNLLSSHSPLRLLYSLQIIDFLRSSPECPNWGSVFIQKGGLANLFEVFMSEKLLPAENEEWNEWSQECLAHLLKLLFQFGIQACAQQGSIDTQQRIVPSSSIPTKNIGESGGGHIRSHHVSGSSSGSGKRLRRKVGKFHLVVDKKVVIPQFSDDLLKLLGDTDLIFDKLIRILSLSSISRRTHEPYYYTTPATTSGRGMIVHHVMNFLSSWCKSDPKFPEIKVFKYEDLLKALILDDTDASTRREACNGFFRLHYASIVRSHDVSNDSNMGLSAAHLSIDNHSDSQGGTTRILDNPSQRPSNFSTDLLACLIKFLPNAESMRPPKPIRAYVSDADYLREMNLPGCKDYFWLTCRLIEAPHTNNNPSHPVRTNRRRTHSKGSTDEHDECQMDLDLDNHPNQSTSNVALFDPMGGAMFDATASKSPVDLNDLCKYLVTAIRRRPVFETRDYSIEDDTLRGMLMMMVMAIRRDTQFIYTTDAENFIMELYSYLFAPPTEQYRYLPKCKSGATRSTAFDLMIALVEQCPKNYMKLLDLLIHDQHLAVVKCTHPPDYWPHEDCRSETGFVGLINLGATCYLATCMQHLFMIPDLRYAILSIQDPKGIRHGEIMRELQKIFAFLLESERKAFNPRNFCKVYTMDNHPLNIAEQTDMTEFLTDLITKIEESSPVLRQIIKSLFSGTLSNNVVSLDCPHISRTTEEFYTLRVQVANMRNLNDSLDELTVKDTLEGDNMYTCSHCEKKVRAEKRACIVKLPRILCFNTMRYTFNMTTMTKEKVNTHFSFPLKLDMSDYLESNLMKRQQTSSSPPTSCSSNCPSRNSSTGSSSSGHESAMTNSGPKDEPMSVEQDEGATSSASAASTAAVSATNNANESADVDPAKSSSSCGSGSNRDTTPVTEVANNEQDAGDSKTMYELIGVTVHTGNADGGHYYCFVRDCEDNSTDKPRWYLFNDAEVKPFDDSHIGTECFGGDITTKSYDAINDRFMDFSIEKTNSAYMLFYKRVDYKYRSKSVALRYLESDTQRCQFLPTDCPTKPLDEPMLASNSSPMKKQLQNHGLAMQCHNDVAEQSGAPMSPSDVLTPAHEAKASSNADAKKLSFEDQLELAANRYSAIFGEVLDFRKLCRLTYDDFVLPRHLAYWIWHENLRFSRDQYIFEHNYFDFMWQICASVPRTLAAAQCKPLLLQAYPESFSVPSERIATATLHLAIVFVLGVLINSREKPHLGNWTDLIRKQFNSSRAACDWAMQLIDDDDAWLKQMLMKCPSDTIRQLFQRVYSDLTGTKQHKKMRLVK